MMKKAYILFLLLFAIIALSLSNVSSAQLIPSDRDLMVVDPKCIKLETQGDKGRCEVICRKACVDAEKYCRPSFSPNLVDAFVCIDLIVSDEGDNFNYSEINAFGFNWGPPHRAWPSIIRAGFTVVFGIMALYLLYNVLKAFYLRTTAGDNAEKVEQSSKLLKGSVIGLFMVLGALILAQIVAVLLGLSSSLTNFSFVPRQGEGNIGTISADEARNGFCLIGQSAQIRGGADVVCVAGRWQ